MPCGKSWLFFIPLNHRRKCTKNKPCTGDPDCRDLWPLALPAWPWPLLKGLPPWHCRTGRCSPQSSASLLEPGKSRPVRTGSYEKMGIPPSSSFLVKRLCLKSHRIGNWEGYGKLSLPCWHWSLSCKALLFLVFVGKNSSVSRILTFHSRCPSLHGTYHSRLHVNVEISCGASGNFSSLDKRCKEREYQGPLGVAGLCTSGLSADYTSDRWPPPCRRLGDLLTNSGSCCSENV